MTTQYRNHLADAPIRSVEFTEVNGVRHAFFHLAPQADRAAIRTLLGGLQETMVTETQADGHPLLVTEGAATPEQIIHALNARGNGLALPPPEAAKFRPWVWRGITSIIGQSLQIASSLTGTGAKGDRTAIFGFASLNLVANFINIVFGAQKKPDKHQLRQLKEQFNQELAPLARPGEAMPDPDTHRLDAYAGMEPPKSFGQKLHGLLQKYSVSFGEIGLRTVGSFSLAFPLNQLGRAAAAFKESGTFGERFSKAVGAARNSNPKTFAVGLMMLTGKGVSFLAKEPDPYNPDPPTMVGRLREKVMFRLSSVIEGLAAGYMTYDRFKNQKITLGGKQYRDHFGGWGNVVFVGGYAVRFNAPYGTLEVNMPELYTHLSDALAKLPPQEIAPQTARIAAELADHFQAKKLDMATAYAQLAAMLKQHHGIEVAPPAALNTEPAAAPATPPQPVAHAVQHQDRVAALPALTVDRPA